MAAPFRGGSELEERYQASDITRRFLPSSLRRDVVFDGDGFIDPSCPAMSFSELLHANARAIVIRGRPWLGKSYLFDAICGHEADLDLGAFVWSKQLQDHSQQGKLLPRQWDEWKDSDAQACWLIDSMDEGELVAPNLWNAIVEQIESLPEGSRSRLRVIAFSRAEQFLERFAGKMQALFGDGYIDVDLLEWGREDARQWTGDDQIFSETLQVVRKYGLQKVSALPAAFCYIKNNRKKDMTIKDVWRGVLMELLREKSSNPLRRRGANEHAEDRFTAAARVAAVMTFAGISEVCDGELDGIHQVDEFINIVDESDRRRRIAAKEAIQTAMFREGKRFAQKHVQEWMCAFGLQNVPLTRLKPLVTGEDGRIVARHYELLSLLTLVSEFGKEIQSWLVELEGGVPHSPDSNPYSLLEARLILDRLGDLADRSTTGLDIWTNKGFENLTVAGIGAELARRLSDRNTSEAQQAMLIDVALATDSREVVGQAIGIVCDGQCGIKLRKAATRLVCDLASNAELLELDAYTTLPSRSRIDKYTKATLIYHFLRRELWDIPKVAQHAMPLVPSGDTLDEPHVLFYRLTEDLTLPAAGAVVAFEVTQLKRRKDSSRRRDQTRHDLLDKALSLLIEAPEATTADLKSLVPLALAGWYDDFLTSFNFIPAIRKSRETRRSYVLQGYKLLGKGQLTHFGALHWFLAPEDVDWLLKHSLAFAKSSPELWTDLYGLSWSDSFVSHRELLRQFIERHRPGLTSILDQQRIEWQAKEEQRKAEGERRWQKPVPIPLVDAVNKTLERDPPVLQQQFWQLSCYCFGRDQWRPRALSGQWGDLSEEIRQRVLSLCREALHHCESTPIPDGSSFPTVVLYESWSFVAVLRQNDTGFKLTDELIRKWLPCSYFMWHESWNEVVFLCHEVSSTATEDVAIEAVHRELRSMRDGVSTAATNYPLQLWSPRFSSALCQIVQDAQFAEDGRAQLLKILTKNAPDAALAVLEQVIHGEPHGCFWTAALDGLLRLEPELAWPWLEDEFNRRGKSLFSELRCFYSDHRPVGLDRPAWTLDRLIKLARMIHQSFPIECDNSQAGIGTVDAEYVSVRWSICRLVFDRNGPGDRDALTALAQEFPILNSWIERQLQREATIAALEPSPYLPFEQVVRLLENADFHIIRNSADLHDALVDRLRQIGQQAPRFIEMLYLPGETSEKERRRHESALQAYVECRLNDILPGRITGQETTIRFHREAQGYFRSRTDILVSAPTIGRSWAEVVIEVKWSDNKDSKHGKVCNALREQLGEVYLLKEQRTHGIYLIGWIGNNVSWSKSAGRPPEKPTTIHTLEHAFRSQATLFTNENPAIRITPVVWDLQWVK